MSGPELRILERLIERLDRLQVSVANDIGWMEQAPRDLAECETMASHRQSAARAVLKSFEQLQDQLARTFRVIPSLMGQDSSQWFARDHADFMDGTASSMMRRTGARSSDCATSSSTITRLMRKSSSIG